jgi:hypothetical protein
MLPPNPLTIQDSLEDAKMWVVEAQRHASHKPPVLLVGNMVDDAPHRQVATKEAKVQCEFSLDTTIST